MVKGFGKGTGHSSLCTHLAGQLCVMQTTSVAQGSSTIRSSAPFRSLSTIAAMASSRGRGSPSLPRLIITTRKATCGSFSLLRVATHFLVIVAAVHWWIGISRCVRHACLMVGEDYVAHTLKRHLDPLALLNHFINFVERRNRLRRHANALVVMCFMSISTREHGNLISPIGHLVK